MIWQQRLHQLIDEFLAPRVITEDLLQPLRNAISELGQSESVELSPALVSYWMEKQLVTTQQPGSLYSGRHHLLWHATNAQYSVSGHLCAGNAGQCFPAPGGSWPSLT